MNLNPEFSLSSPNFNRYSDSNLVNIAARVVEEFRAEHGDAGSEFSDHGDAFSGMKMEAATAAEEKNSDGEEDFEFPREMAFPPISADEIFYNGQIRPIYPVFGRNWLTREAEFGNVSPNWFAKANYGVSLEERISPKPVQARISLGKLLIAEREIPSSCSLSEADELDKVPAEEETYCVWQPKLPGEPSPPRCKKSNSTGSSKLWKFRNLLHRSNSDGKDAFVFFTSPFKKRDDKKVKKPATSDAPLPTGKLVPKENFPAEAAAAAHQAKRGGDKRRSYVYKQDFMGFFLHTN